MEKLFAEDLDHDSIDGSFNLGIPNPQKRGNAEDRQRGRGNQMIARQPGRVCRLRAVRL
jgi:hypothetical protein